jgi:ssDNA-binding Zn-finger/Zn-ribbon topoisomerase 1
MGENESNVPEWKMKFGNNEQIQHFEQHGKTYLNKFSELFYWTFKMTQLVKKGHSYDILAKNLIQAYSECRKCMTSYLLGAVFFIDINAQTTLEYLNRINNVLIEMKDPQLIFTNGFLHVFLGFVSKKLDRTISSELAFKRAAEIFPSGSIYSEFAQKQLSGEYSFQQWVNDCLTYYELQDGDFLTELMYLADQIHPENYHDEFTDTQTEVSVRDYEKKFLEKRAKEKRAMTHVRRCPNCNYFMVAEGNAEKNCPRCKKPMQFALYCPTCGIWYNVKTAKKYMCPTCGNLMIKKEKV